MTAPSSGLKLPIFLDHHSTTPVDPRVVEAMLPCFTENFGNPASRNHRFGWEADAAVGEAREICARAINAEPREITFTSGATESINLVLKGLVARWPSSAHFIATAVEHNAVLDTLRHLESRGAAITLLAVDADGRIDPAALAAAIRPDTLAVSVIFANNEIGTINRIAELGAICRDRDVVFHTDAAQALGKIPIDVEAMKIDALTGSAHKFYGPKGIGFSYVRKSMTPRIEPLVHGGGHERGLRSGTLNVPAIVGMGAALRIALEKIESEAERLKRMRDRLRDELMRRIPLTRLNGHPTERLPGNLNMSFACVEGEALLISLHDIALSTGSACTSASIKPSHVLKAIGLSDEMVHSSVRFGLGRWTTDAEIDHVIRRVTEEVARLRELSPRYEKLRLSA